MSGSVAGSIRLEIEEALFYRDRLRAARYAALADAEGFTEICFAVESLGMRLHRKQAALGKGTEGYAPHIRKLSELVSGRDALVEQFPGCFSRFDALYEMLRSARNDAMHGGAYARHATSAAIEICIHLEEAVMGSATPAPGQVQDFMVRQVVVVESWQPIAHVRQLMLMHSFSFLPVYVEGTWKLISEMSVAKFLQHEKRKERLAMPISDAAKVDTAFLEIAIQIRPDSKVIDMFTTTFGSGGRLWLVTEADDSVRLLGVLSPFELMSFPQSM